MKKYTIKEFVKMFNRDEFNELWTDYVIREDEFGRDELILRMDAIKENDGPLITMNYENKLTNECIPIVIEEDNAASFKSINQDKLIKKLKDITNERPDSVGYDFLTIYICGILVSIVKLYEDPVMFQFSIKSAIAKASKTYEV